VLGRLRAITWNDEDAAFDHTSSRVALLREYLRRAALWARAYQADGAWPFFDIAERVDPAIRAQAEVVAELDGYIWDNVGLPSIERTCRGAVHWAAFRAQARVELPGADDPYEPLLLMYERGGGFSTESNSFDLTGIMLPTRPLEDYLSTEPVVRLDTHTLDALDAAGGRAG